MESDISCWLCPILSFPEHICCSVQFTFKSWCSGKWEREYFDVPHDGLKNRIKPKHIRQSHIFFVCRVPGSAYWCNVQIYKMPLMPVQMSVLQECNLNKVQKDNNNNTLVQVLQMMTFLFFPFFFILICWNHKYHDVHPKTANNSIVSLSLQSKSW